MGSWWVRILGGRVSGQVDGWVGGRATVRCLVCVSSCGCPGLIPSSEGPWEGRELARAGWGPASLSPSKVQGCALGHKGVKISPQVLLGIKKKTLFPSEKIPQSLKGQAPARPVHSGRQHPSLQEPQGRGPPGAGPAVLQWAPRGPRGRTQPLPQQQLTDTWAPEKALPPASAQGRSAALRSVSRRPRTLALALGGQAGPGGLGLRGAGRGGRSRASGREAALTTIGFLGGEVRVVVLVVGCGFLGRHDGILQRDGHSRVAGRGCGPAPGDAGA